MNAMVLFFLQQGLIRVRSFFLRASQRNPPLFRMMIQLWSGVPAILLFTFYVPDVAGHTPRTRLFTILTSCLFSATVVSGIGRLWGRTGLALLVALASPGFYFSASHGMAFGSMPRLSVMIPNSFEIFNLQTLQASAAFAPLAMAAVLALSLAVALLLPPETLGFGTRSWAFPLTAWCTLFLLGCILRPPMATFKMEGIDQGIRNHGIFLSYGLDLASALGVGSAHEQISLLKADQESSPPATLATQSRTDRLVLVQVESLDWNVLNQAVGNELVAPFFHELSQTMTLLPARPNHSPVSGSSGSDFQVLTGFRPILDTPVYKSAAPYQSASLPAWLKAGGLPLDVFHGNVPHFWNRKEAFARMGVHRFHTLNDIPATQKSNWGAADRDLFAYFLHWSREQKGPFAALAITISSHAPFDLVDVHEIQGRGVVNRYFNSIRYIDHAFEDLIRNWNAGSTIFIVYGDHASKVRGADYSSYPGEEEIVPVLVFRTDQGRIYKVEVKEPSRTPDLASLYGLAKLLMSNAVW